MAILSLKTVAFAVAALQAVAAKSVKISHLGASSSAAASTHYGDPADGCLSDETSMKVNGVPGDFCSPACDSSTPCPTDVPAGTSAEPQCALEASGASSPTNCALICDPNADGRDGCPHQAECRPVQQTGVCTYAGGGPGPSPPSPSPPSPPSPPGSGYCSELNQYLPSFCECRDITDGAKVLCKTSVLGQDLKMSLLVAPCAKPDATIKFEIAVDGVPWDYSVSAGDKGAEPIPGLVWDYIAVEFDAVLDYELDGNANALEIKLGLDACGSVLGVSRCLSYELPADFPINILDATVNFGECADKKADTTSYLNINATLV